MIEVIKNEVEIELANLRSESIINMVINGDVRRTFRLSASDLIKSNFDLIEQVAQAAYMLGKLDEAEKIAKSLEIK